jgi:lipoate-protein ligase A
VHRWHGSAADFHARTVEVGAGPQVWVFEVARPALVLGSSQPIDSIDRHATAAAGIELVRRRSGGGSVLLDPGDVVWFDVIVPASVLRELGVGDDVAGAMRWAGEQVSSALGRLGVTTQVHRGAMVTTRWSPVICFDGLGPGELGRNGAKLVGMSARRTRDHSRFQCAVPQRWRPERLIGLLARPRPEPTELRAVAVTDAAVGEALPAVVASVLADVLAR